MPTDLTPFEREFMLTLPRDVHMLPGYPSTLSKGQRDALVNLQRQQLVSVKAESAHIAKVALTEKGRAALGRG